MLGSERFTVILLIDTCTFSDLFKNLRGVVEKGASLDIVSAFSPIGSNFVLTLEMEILVGRLDQWNVKCAVYCFLDTKHDVKDHVEVAVSDVDCLRTRGQLTLSSLTDCQVSWYTTSL